MSLVALTEWASNARKLLLGTNEEHHAVVVEFVGMPGTEKSHLWSELQSKFVFTKKGIDIGTSGEPQMQVWEVERGNEKAFLKGERKRAFDDLTRAVAPANKKDLILLDRGVIDLVAWFNKALNRDEKELNQGGPVISEEECQEEIKEAVRFARGKVDILVVHTDSIERAIKCTTPVESSGYMGSAQSFSEKRISRKSEKEAMEDTYAWYAFYQYLYREQILKSTEIRRTVRTIADIDLEKHGRLEPGSDFKESSIFQHVVIIIDLYLVFKAWEMQFFTWFENELKGETDRKKQKKRICDFVSKTLRGHLESLYREMSHFDSMVKTILINCGKTEFVIARNDSMDVVMSGIFDSEPTIFIRDRE